MFNQTPAPSVSSAHTNGNMLGVCLGWFQTEIMGCGQKGCTNKKKKGFEKGKNQPRQGRLTIICESVGSWWWERQLCDPEWVRVQPWHLFNPKTYNYTHLNVKRCSCRWHATTQQRRTFLFSPCSCRFRAARKWFFHRVRVPESTNRAMRTPPVMQNAAALTKSIFWEMNGIAVIEKKPAATKPLMAI